MTAFSYDWDSSFESKPDNDNYGYEIDDYMRKIILCIRERMEVEHVWKVGATDGEHIPGECKTIYVGTKSTFPTAKQGCEAIATDESNRPYICLVEGTWTVRPVGYIGANIDVLAGVTIDGIDISAHAAGTAKSQHTAGMGDHTHESAGAEGGKLTSIFGAWETKTSGTDYTATTDGVVCAMSTPNCYWIKGWTPVATVRKFQETADAETVQSIDFPVKKGNTWKVTCQSGTATVYWLPIGG